MNEFVWTVELRFAVALALGLLVGLERESARFEKKKLIFGGVRTHPLISLLGFGCAWLFTVGVVWALPAAFLVLGALTSIAYIAKMKGEQYGTTSEVSALLTFVTGALACLVEIWGPMALGVVNALLLSEKARLESTVERLDRVEFLATLKFLIVTVIILPVLPDREYTQFGLNPSEIWQIVILVSTIGFAGYILSKKFGPKVGLWLSGLLGGIASSTAVSVAAGRIARTDPSRGGAALQAALLASAVMYLRILALLAFVGPGLVPQLWWKFLILAGIGVGLTAGIRARGPETPGGDHPQLQNPFEITPALLFAAVFVVLLVVTGWVRTVLGDTWTVVLSLVVGVADVDPFILSVAAAPPSAITPLAILLAVMSNTAAKGVYVATLAPAIRRPAAWRYALWAGLHLPFVLIPGM